MLHPPTSVFKKQNLIYKMNFLCNGLIAKFSYPPLCCCETASGRPSTDKVRNQACNFAPPRVISSLLLMASGGPVWFISARPELSRPLGCCNLNRVKRSFI